MAQYMLQFSYTSDAWAALSRKPANRSKPLAALATKLGAKLISLHYTMGEYDGISVIEARNDETATAVIMAAIAPGHVRAAKTTRLYTVKETIGALKKAGGAATLRPQGLRVPVGLAWS
ncbi:MAG: GYD domain-containing protein [Gemmatimonadetes bacterium]|nr:GYD domain-containing protein [Gemmatimonadota bacterium]